jgi:hypothetical protein
LATSSFPRTAKQLQNDTSEPKSRMSSAGCSLTLIAVSLLLPLLVRTLHSCVSSLSDSQFPFSCVCVCLQLLSGPSRSLNSTKSSPRRVFLSPFPTISKSKPVPTQLVDTIATITRTISLSHHTLLIRPSLPRQKTARLLETMESWPVHEPRIPTVTMTLITSTTILNPDLRLLVSTRLLPPSSLTPLTTPTLRLLARRISR